MTVEIRSKRLLKAYIISGKTKILLLKTLVSHVVTYASETFVSAKKIEGLGYFQTRNFRCILRQ
jgi:hypothetical protein